MQTTPTKPLIVSSFGATDRGLVRAQNEDNFLIDDDRGVYAVADGLGGVPNGDKASALAVHMISEYYDDAVLRGDIFLRDMFEAINKAVYTQGHNYSPDLGMATTLTVAQLNGTNLAIGHVGDSAIYLYRAGTLRQITADHTLKAAVCQNLSYEEYENVPEALSHTLTRCIGHRPTVEVDMMEMPLQAGDRILICTDGITKYVDPEILEKIFAIATSPEMLVQKLIKEANDHGGADNATAIGLFVRGSAPKIFGLSSGQAY